MAQYVVTDKLGYIHRFPATKDTYFQMEPSSVRIMRRGTREYQTVETLAVFYNPISCIKREDADENL